MWEKQTDKRDSARNIFEWERMWGRQRVGKRVKRDNVPWRVWKLGRSSLKRRPGYLVGAWTRNERLLSVPTWTQVQTFLSKGICECCSLYRLGWLLTVTRALVTAQITWRVAVETWLDHWGLSESLPSPLR